MQERSNTWPYVAVTDPEAVGWRRREFHAAGLEISGRQETSRRVAELLGLVWAAVCIAGWPGTGASWRRWRTARAGYRSLRADIKTPCRSPRLGSVSYRSRRAGVMHARPRWTHRDAMLAATPPIGARPATFPAGNRPLCLPAWRKRTSWRRAQNGGGGVVRALPDGRHLRAA